MSIKYSLNDVLIESGVRDFREIAICADWTPTDKHKTKMEKIFNSADGRVSGRLKSILAAAAAAAIIFGVLAAVKPVRDGVASFFSGLFTKPAHTVTDTDTTAQTHVTEPDTDAETTEPAMTSDIADAVLPDDARGLIYHMADYGVSTAAWKKLRECGDGVDVCLHTLKTEDYGVITGICTAFVTEKLYDELRKTMEWDDATARTGPFLYGSLASGEMCSATYMSECAGHLQEYFSENVSTEKLHRDYPVTAKILSAYGWEYEDKYDPKNKTVEENVNRLCDHGYDETTHDRLKRSYEAFQYCVENYYSEPDRYKRSVMSIICAEYLRNCGDDGKSSRHTYPLKLLLGDDGYKTLFEIDGEVLDMRYVSEKADVYSAWLLRFTGLLKEAAANLTRQTFESDLSEALVILDKVGFDGYRTVTEEERRIVGAINDAMQLYNAVRFGSVNLSGLEYETYSEGSATLTDGMKDHLGKFYDLPDQMQEIELVSVKGALHTYGGWYEKYSKLLPSDTVKALLQDSARFIVVDGDVYVNVFTTAGNEWMHVADGTVRVVEKNGGVYRVTAVVSRKYDVYSEETFIIEETEDGGLRLTGGTYFEKYPGVSENEMTKAKAAAVVYEVIKAHAALYNADTAIVAAVDESTSSAVFEDLGYRRIEEGGGVPGLTVNGTAYPAYAGLYCGQIALYRYARRDIADAMLSPGGAVSYAKFTSNSLDWLEEDVILLSPGSVKTKTTPAIGAASEISFIDLYDALEVVSASADSYTVSLKFIREENGTSTEIAYTFTVSILTDDPEYAGPYGTRPMLSGGTFAELLISDK